MPEPTNSELLVHISYVREDIQGVHARLDTLNGRTRTLENDVAVLKSSADTTPSKKDLRNYGAGFGAAGASAVGVLYALWELMTK